MSRVAGVIVDVPSRSTDRPFSYAVPADMRAWIEPGSRVGVPFAGRTLQGFVVSLADEPPAEGPAKLKPIAELLDPLPPLLPDLVELARWISEKYCCTWTAALQAMVPSAIKGKAERHLRLADGADEPAAEAAAESAAARSDVGRPEAFWAMPGEAAPELPPSETLPQELVRELRRHGSLKLEAARQRWPEAGGAIKRALAQGVLIEETSIRDRIGVRTQLTVYPPLDREAAKAALEALPGTAKRQKELLLYVLALEGPVTLQAMLADTGASASSAKALADKGYILVEEAEQQRDPYAGREFRRSEPLPLTDAQREVFVRIRDAVERTAPATFLLQGVTGSGKTEIYMQSIQRALELGREAIVLVPEISLTPQMVERFKGRFGDEVAVLHSRLSSGERYDEWRRIRRGGAKVAIGARSAVFAPFARLGLIVIDEEHESSYKQEETPKYHARDVAVQRARQHGAVVVLGSATPSLETYAAAARDGAGGALLRLSERAVASSLPPVTVTDMRDELKSGNRSMFSRALHEALQARLERGEQSVLLLNRRGYSTFVICRSCGYTALCPHCDISLTYHQKTRAMRCHYCGHAELAPSACPSCESEQIRYFGAGTQKVEEELAKLFPGIRVIRMDVDTTTEKNAHEKWLKLFGERKADVLLGTQMVAKGLDFPYVTLVGVIAADTSLNLPDFRAAERTFQLLTQVAGRAGRHHLPGEVIIQTYNPEHYAVIASQRHDYEGFVAEEMKHRRMMGYPPFCRLILVTMSHEQLATLSAASDRFARRLIELAGQRGVLQPLHGSGARALELLGPVASPISRIKDRYRFQCMVKYRGAVPAAELVSEAIRQAEAEAPRSGVLFSVDVDPHMIL
ncbi:Helicase PriA essential for oriC/DnaA-independent DNA replication [Paenibacillus pasadenensis]|uniref:Replication restart protein PriA n=1 Tax=Paenibacillus pasadenensis TaxID=217090 RepID=A0A2N5N7K6_9BACL|nr:primosomal protein N' [Paenibacillus pasadenensis]PLT46336.1 Helicase PriA essential for oriC/DnaA-independent DNA replication [Paenibacillus pasadenensis]